MSGDVPVGVDLQAWAVGETTRDTPQAFTAADAVAPISLKITPTLEFHKSKEHVGTASLQTEIEGKRGGTWAFEGYAKPSTLGTPLDISDMLRVGTGRMVYDLTVNAYASGALDTVLVTHKGTLYTLTEGTDFAAATSNDVTAANIAAAIVALGIPGLSATSSAAVVTVTSDNGALLVTSGDVAAWSITRLGYALRGKNHTPQSLQIGKNVGHTLHERVNGAWVSQIEFQITGNDECKVMLSGGFSSYSQLKGEPLTDTTGYASGVATVGMAAGSRRKIKGTPYVYFERVSDGAVVNNGGAGYRVASVDPSGGTITLASNLGGSGLSAAAWYVRPFVPSQTLAGTIQGGIDAGLTVASDSVGVISYKVTINTGIHGLDKEATANRANRLSRGDRTVEGEIQVYSLDENVDHLSGAWDGDTQNITARMGPDTSGSRILLVAPAARIEVQETEVPEAEEATVSAKFVARQSAAAEDEFRVDLT